jgi:glycosyltransferase involved in cell wall biosynthesis
LGAPPTARTFAGGDRHAFEVWQRWSEHPDVQLTVIACAAGAQMAADFGHHFDVTLTETKPSDVGALRLGYIGRFVGALRRVRNMTPVDVVYAETPYFYDVLPAVAAKRWSKARRMIVTFFHLTPPPASRSGNPLVNAMAWIEQRVMVWFIARYADKVIVADSDVRDELVRQGIKPSSIVITRMGAQAVQAAKPAAARTPDASQTVPNTTRYDAISVGRLAPAKGIGMLLDAWAIVARERPGAMLALVGGEMPGFDADYEVRRRALQEAANIIRGASDTHLSELMTASTIFITASTEEGYGMAVGEALAFGLPCVTFDLPAFRAAFPFGRHVARQRTADALARAAIDLLADPDLRERLSADVKREWRYPSWDDVASSLWRECIQED